MNKIWGNTKKVYCPLVMSTNSRRRKKRTWNKCPTCRRIHGTKRKGKQNTHCETHRADAPKSASSLFGDDDDDWDELASIFS